MEKTNGALKWKIEKTVKKGNYLYAVVKDHPNATKYNYVLYHRIVMENHLGRLLNPNEIVHHKNENKHDNNIENLELTTNSKHATMHGLERGRKYVRLKCPSCKKIFDLPLNQTFLQKRSSYTCCSSICRGRFSRLIQLKGLTPQVERAISENLLNEFRKTPRKL